jgi:Flp pilus assembly protein TadD
MPGHHARMKVIPMRWTGWILSGLLLAVASGGGTAEARSPVASMVVHQDEQAATMAAAGQLAATQGDVAAALHHAERAVALAPRDAQYRAQLGRAYLAAGRFASAEAAFGDALALDPSLGSAAVKRALAQIALGRESAAQESLALARGKACDADVGLAMALAGQRSDALALLEAAARRGDADARTRQNLALVYAFEGRWTDAAATAARDVPADHMAERLRRWALIVQRGPRTADQVMAILGVAAVRDPGEPASLALIVSTPAVPQMVAIAAPPLDVRPTALAAVTVDLTPTTVGIETLVPNIPTPPSIRPTIQKASPIRYAAFNAPSSGKFVVQLGAFYSRGAIQTAWKRLSGNAAYLQAYRPSGSQVRARLHGGSFYRLALSGFDRRADAARVCQRIRANGGACFVRAASGDRPITWAKAGRDQNRA